MRLFVWRMLLVFLAVGLVAWWWLGDVESKQLPQRYELTVCQPDSENPDVAVRVPDGWFFRLKRIEWHVAFPDADERFTSRVRLKMTGPSGVGSLGDYVVSRVTSVRGGYVNWEQEIDPKVRVRSGSGLYLTCSNAGMFSSVNVRVRGELVSK